VIRKRLVGVVTVKDGHAVQSFGYRRYLPLGKPEVLVENLDRWGADEILLQCIDRSGARLGPDLALLQRVAHKGIATPLIYGGGIRSADDARSVINAGADRVCVDALLHDGARRSVEISEALGAQALLGAFPLTLEGGALRWLEHRSRALAPLSDEVLEVLRAGVISEALIIDFAHEGNPGAFDLALLASFPVAMPLIAFGGLSEASQLAAVLHQPSVVAAAVGNFLSYREHAVQAYKEQMVGLPLRTSHYEPPPSV
jgi:imidazole glycerol-phosphate synthase subunit HisF